MVEYFEPETRRYLRFPFASFVNPEKKLLQVSSVTNDFYLYS